MNDRPEQERWLQPVNDSWTGDSKPSRREPGGGGDDERLLDAYSQAVISVVERVLPAVVQVSGPPGQQPQGTGSGFMISAGGFALTNSHVAQGRSLLVATTHEGDRLAAELVGDDPATDLALIRVQASDLPSTELGDSHALRVGQLVIAIGDPLGLQSTVSTGIVGGLGRSMRGADGRLIENVVQHSAPLNPGNSGGPLVDSRCRVVGVNTAVVALAQGLGFAVPAATARWVLGELMAHGRVRRRTLGVRAAAVPLPRRLADAMDLVSDRAVEIVDVDSGGLARRAGVRTGDLLVAINGRLVNSVDDVHRLLAHWPAEQQMVLEVIRGRQLLELPVLLGS